MSFQENLGRIVLRAFAGLATVAALASCGGGTYQVKAFVPARILTFGDESNSLIGPQGLKYSINALSPSTDQIDCSLSPLWDQVLATSYGLTYANCNTQAVAQPLATDLSTINATVDDVAAQVSAFQSGDAFNSNDLVTIWVGTHDVLNDYTANGAGDQPTLIADMRASGSRLAAVVNAIAATGAKTILLTMPDLGDSPFAATEQARGDFDRTTLLSQMSLAFNNSLRSNIVNDGSKIGLVLVDDFTHNAVRSPGSYNLISSPNVTAGCIALAPLPDCDDNTLLTDAVKNSDLPTIYLWADATHLAPTAHLQIGNQAVSRAHSNPF
jgi:outer membrane lipase/esterase